MSDVKESEPKPPAPADPSAGTPAKAEATAGKPEAAKPAEAKPAAAATPPAPAPAPPKPAPAKSAETKAPEPKPAPAPAPVAAAVAAPPSADAAAGRSDPRVGVTRAPAPKLPDKNVNITITANAALLIMGGLVVSVVSLLALTVFLLVRLNDRHPLDRIVDQRPGMDKKAGGGSEAGGSHGGGSEEAPTPPPKVEPEKTKIGEFFEAGQGKPSAIAGSWPSFRGAARDNIGGSEVKLANRWPEKGPPILWEQPLAEGYAGAAVHKGRVYVLDYDTVKKGDALRCFSLDDGKEIWRTWYHVTIKNSHGFTRTVPAVTDKYVVTIGPMCHVMCVEAETGAFKWGIDLTAEYGTQDMTMLWYTAQCPLIDGSTVVIAPCGKDVLMMGVDLETGKPVWKTPNPNGRKMSHSSIVPMTFKGKKMYVYAAEWGNMVGISAEKDMVGTQLWEVKCLNKQVVSPSPVILEDGYIFMTAGYQAGSALVQVTEEGGKFQAKTLWNKEGTEGLACEQQTPIYFNKRVYGLQVSDPGVALKDQLICMDPYNNGKVVWNSGKEKRFGHYEAFMLADDKIYVVSEKGALTMVKASADKYEPLGEYMIFSGGKPDAWAPFALAGNRMLLRDSKKMICIDVGKGIE